MGKNTFTRELRAEVQNDPTQQWVASTTPRSRGDNMSAKEQLIVQYNLRDYMRDYIISADPRMDFTDEQKKKTYRGLLRNKSGVSNP